MISIDFSVGSHGIGYPANCVAQHYAEHQPSIKLTKDHDNGQVVGVGKWLSLDVFEQGTVTSFEGEIVMQNVDGTYMILVKKAENAAYIYNEPLSPYEEPVDLKDEKAMYNKKGDTVRTYILHYLDRVSSSVEDFDGTPEVGKTITGISADGKFTVGA